MPTGYTALGSQQPQHIQKWVNSTFTAFRENFFFDKFLGTGDNSIIQSITEMKKTAKGDRAMVGLVAEMRGTGIVGDNDINDREESLEATWIEIHSDQLRNGVKSKGVVDSQRSILDFRKEARDKLAYWRAAMIEELTILTASGISYQYRTDGSTRLVGAQDDPRTLDFAADVTAPSSNRHFYYDGTNLKPGDTTQITSACVPKYGMIVDLMAEASTRGIKKLRTGGEESYVFLTHPKFMAQLKKDPDYNRALVNAGVRGDKNPIFTGSSQTTDGLIFHTNNRVFNTYGAVNGSKWGAGGMINGTRSLLMGCQSMLFADIEAQASWFEEKIDAGAKDRIVIGMYFGLRKPQFKSAFDGDTVQDFGMMCVDTFM